MQQMAELVEDRLHLAVGQQRGLAAYRRRQVPADQTQVRLNAGKSRQERVHPSSAPLVFPWKPIGVKRSQRCAISLVVNRVIAHLRIPNRRAGLGDRKSTRL